MVAVIERAGRDAMAEVIPQPMEACTRHALEHEGGAEALRAAPGLPAVLRDAAWTVGPGAAGATAQPAVVRGAPNAELILAQDAGMLGALGGVADDAAALGRGVTGSLRAASPLGALMLGAYGAETLQGWAENRAVERSADALGFDLGTAEGVVGARHHAFFDGAWGLEVAFPSVSPDVVGSVGTGAERGEVAAQALSLFALSHPEEAARAWPGGEAHREMTAWVDGSMAALDAGRLRVSEEGWAEGWREVFPALDEAGRRLGELGGFGAGVQVDQGWVEGLPDQRERIENLTRPGGLVPPELPDTAVEGMDATEPASLGDGIVAMGSNDRMQNPDRADSPIWNELDVYRGGIRTNGERGRDREYYEWDNTHNDIEVYDRRGKHRGTMDPVTGEMIKDAVPGRRIDL